jgi:hypothetical protein
VSSRLDSQSLLVVDLRCDISTWRGMKVAIKQLLDDSDESVEQFKKEIETMRCRPPILLLHLSLVRQSSVMSLACLADIGGGA